MKFSKFFSALQEAPWYREFLDPVIEAINHSTDLLDIGTGSGKMLEILYKEKNINSVGTDTNQDMLNEAKEKLKNTKCKLILTPPGQNLPLENSSFDFITICSVLFHLKQDEIDSMLDELFPMLKEGGKMIILTPTGSGNIFKLTKHFFSLKNKTIYVWYRATKKRAQKWTKENYLSGYSKEHNLNYTRKEIMNGFAQMEVLSK